VYREYTMELQESNRSDIQVQVFDTSGKMQYDASIYEADFHTIDLPVILPGIYMLRVNTGSEAIAKRIVIL